MLGSLGRVLDVLLFFSATNVVLPYKRHASGLVDDWPIIFSVDRWWPCCVVGYGCTYL